MRPDCVRRLWSVRCAHTKWLPGLLSPIRARWRFCSDLVLGQRYNDHDSRPCLRLTNFVWSIEDSSLRV